MERPETHVVGFSRSPVGTTGGAAMGSAPPVDLGSRVSTMVPLARDLSAYRNDASTPEAVLFHAHGIHELTMDCACGGWVTADLDCPGDGVREHQATQQHASWRVALGL